MDSFAEKTIMYNNVTCIRYTLYVNLFSIWKSGSDRKTFTGPKTSIKKKSAVLVYINKFVITEGLVIT